MSGWSNQPVTAVIVIIESVAGTGLFVYSGTPANGNLVASIAAAAGTDPFGNPYKAGITTYDNNAAVYIQLASGNLITGFLAGGSFSDPSLGFSPGDQSLVLESGQPAGAYNACSLELQPRLGPGFTAGLATLLGSMLISDLEAGGQLLTVQNTATPSNSNVEIICNAAGDNALGIMVSGDTFNRIKLTTAALLFGSGSAAQDTQLYRSSAGVFGADTLLANVGGSVEVWHTLGTPGITGWTSNHGRYRLANDGCIEFDFSLVSNGVAHASSITSYPNTLPPAYSPAFNRANALGIDTTITAGDPYPRVFVGTTGLVRIAIPSVAAVTTEISGTFHVPLD